MYDYSIFQYLIAKGLSVGLIIIIIFIPILPIFYIGYSYYYKRISENRFKWARGYWLGRGVY
jgi:hypothetical protein